ncbi:MAG: hypothetical protein AAFS01_07515 [Pseudomonadota bacterium]
MTIGIVASGPWAGAGVLAGLHAAEAVGRGAIGGFVSLAVLTLDGRLLRAETQNSGTKGLFPGDPPDEILQAPRAALISSGPDRPEPLSQFIAAKPGVGLVTGHRFPQALMRDGQPLNGTILSAMQEGRTAQQAVDELIADAPGFDAGFIALCVGGEIGIGNMPSVLCRADQGVAMRMCETTSASVAALHNAIQPQNAIGLLAVEAALDAIQLRQTVQYDIILGAGLRLKRGDAPEVHINEDGQATGMTHPRANDLYEEMSFGMGDRVRVVRKGTQHGWLGHEPFMVVKQGVVVSLDGQASLKVPVLVPA